MIQALDSLTKNLIYVSETDADIVPFTYRKAESVTAAEVVYQSGHKADDVVETLDVDSFFARLTMVKDWYGPRETERAAKYAALKLELEKELNDLKVYKIGKVQINIYVVGLDKQGRLAGVKTTAVET